MSKFIDSKKATFKEFSIPEYMFSGIDLYLEIGMLPGSFLTAVISNDFVGAVSTADGENIRNLPAYANFFYNYTPETCWGSKEKMEKWIEEKQKEISK
jgi:hypothetical protein